MPRVKKIIQARDGGPIPVAYSEVEVGGETVLAPVVVLEAGAQVQLSGSSALGESDQTGSGNGTAEFSTPVRFVDVYNGGSTILTISAGGVTRYVPPGPRLVEFPTAATQFAIVADGEWVATANA